MARDYPMGEWLEFAAGVDYLSADVEAIRDDFTKQVAELAESSLGVEVDDEDELAYLTFQSAVDAGVGLWEGREDWHEKFEDIAMAHHVSDLAVDLEMYAQEWAKPDQERLSQEAVIDDDYSVFFDGKHLGDYDSQDAARAAINKEMKRTSYFPNIFYINERGNIDLLDSKGNILQSWV